MTDQPRMVTEWDRFRDGMTGKTDNIRDIVQETPESDTYVHPVDPSPCACFACNPPVSTTPESDTFTFEMTSVDVAPVTDETITEWAHGISAADQRIKRTQKRWNELGVSCTGAMTDLRWHTENTGDDAVLKAAEYLVRTTTAYRRAETTIARATSERDHTVALLRDILKQGYR